MNFAEADRADDKQGPAGLAAACAGRRDQGDKGRDDADCRRVYVCEPCGLTPGLMNRLARGAGAYAAGAGGGLQINMNGDFISVHCLRPGAYDFCLPFDCQVLNLKTRAFEKPEGRILTLNLTAGETCQFLIGKDLSAWRKGF